MKKITNTYLNDAEIKHLKVFLLSQKKLTKLVDWVRNSSEIQTVSRNTISNLLRGQVLITEDYELIVRKAFEIKSELENELKKVKRKIRVK